MINENITLAIIAACAVIGAAFLHYLWTKAKTIADFRQAWINDLRDELSRFIAMMVSPNDAQSPFDPMQSWSRLQLLLNPKEHNHIELMNLLERLKTAFSHYRHAELETKSESPALHLENPFIEEIAQLTREIGDLGQTILKDEWEVTKQMRLYWSDVFPFRLRKRSAR